MRGFRVTLVAVCGGLAILVLVVMFARTPSKAQMAQPITAQNALQRAQAFLQSAGLEVPKLQASVRLIDRPFGLQRWEVTWPYDFYHYTVEIHPVTGEVRGFYNHRRIWEQVKGVGRTGKTFYRSREEALQYVTQLAKRFGLPRSAVLKKFWCYADGESPHADANKAGSVGAVFCEKPYGYSSLFPNPENRMSLEVDPQDGTLVSFGQGWDVQVESHTVSFPKERAVQKAKRVYADYYRTRRGATPHRGTYTGKVELGYVLPNGMFGGKRYPEAPLGRLRLAWAVYFGEEQVWIDAADGSILGGAILK